MSQKRISGGRCTKQLTHLMMVRLLYGCRLVIGGLHFSRHRLKPSSSFYLLRRCNQVRPVKSLACQNPAVLTSRSGLLASAFGVFHGPRARCIRVAAGSRQARAVEEASGVIDIERVPLGADCMKMECTGKSGGMDRAVL